MHLSLAVMTAGMSMISAERVSRFCRAIRTPLSCKGEGEAAEMRARAEVTKAMVNIVNRVEMGIWGIWGIGWKSKARAQLGCLDASQAYLSSRT